MHNRECRWYIRQCTVGMNDGPWVAQYSEITIVLPTERSTPSDRPRGSDGPYREGIVSKVVAGRLVVFKAAHCLVPDRPTERYYRGDHGASACLQHGSRKVIV